MRNFFAVSLILWLSGWSQGALPSYAASCSERQQFFMELGQKASDAAHAGPYFSYAAGLCGDSASALPVLYNVRRLMQEDSREPVLQDVRRLLGQSWRAGVADEALYMGAQLQCQKQQWSSCLVYADLLRNFYTSSSWQSDALALRIQALLGLSTGYAGWLQADSAWQDFRSRFPQDKRVDSLRLKVAAQPLSFGADVFADSLLQALVATGRDEYVVGEARYLRGWYRIRRGEILQGLARWREFMEKHPGHPHWRNAQQEGEQALADKVVEFGRSGRMQGVDSLGKAYLQLYPAGARMEAVMYARAAALQALGRDSNALVAFRELAGRFGNSSQLAAYRKGWSLSAYRLGNQSESDQVLRHVFSATEMSTREPVLAILDRTLQGLPNGVDLPVLVGGADSLEIRLYRVDAEEFFRTRLRMERIAELDVGLCSPDSQFIYRLPRSHRLDTLRRSIPLGLERPGSYAVRVKAGNLEAVGPVGVSDMSLLTYAGNGRVVVSVRNRAGTRAYAGAKILVSNGKRLLAEGKTNKEGLWQIALGDSLGQDSLQLLAVYDKQVAWSSPLVLGFVDNQMERNTLASILCDKSVYQRSDTAVVSGLLWEPYANEKKATYELDAVIQNAGLSIVRMEIKPDAQGAFTLRVPLRNFPDVDQFVWRIWRNGKEIRSLHAGFDRIAVVQDGWELKVKQKSRNYLRGDSLYASVSLRSSVGRRAGKLAYLAWWPGAPDTLRGVLDSLGNAPLRGVVQTLETEYILPLYVAVPALSLVDTARMVLYSEPASLDLQIDSLPRFPSDTLYAALRLSPTVARIGQGEVRLWVEDSLQRVVLEQNLTLKADTTIRVPLYAPGPGKYRVQAYARTAGGVVGAPVGEWNVRTQYAGIRMDTLPARAVAGQKLPLRVYSGSPCAQALLVVQGANVYEVRPLQLQKGVNVLTVPILPHYAPGVRVEVVAMFDTVLAGTGQNVDVGNALDLAGQLPKGATAGSMAEITLTVRNAMGQGVPAQVWVSVLDSAMVAHYNSARLDSYENFQGVFGGLDMSSGASGMVRLDTVWSQKVELAQVLKPRSDVGMNALASKRKEMGAAATENWLEETSASYEVGSGSGGIGDMLGGLMGGGSGSISTKAKGGMLHKQPLQFPNDWASINRGSVLYALNLKTDAHGKLVVPIRLPMFGSGSWVVQALAFTPGQGYGQYVGRFASTGTSPSALAVAEADSLPYPPRSLATSLRQALTLLLDSCGGDISKLRNGDRTERMRKQLLDMQLHWENDLDLSARGWSLYMLGRLRGQAEFAQWLPDTLKKSVQLRTALERELAKLPLGDDKTALDLLLGMASMDPHGNPDAALLRYQRENERLSLALRARLALCWKTLGRHDYLNVLQTSLRAGLAGLSGRDRAVVLLALGEPVRGIDIFPWPISIDSIGTALPHVRYRNAGYRGWEWQNSAYSPFVNETAPSDTVVPLRVPFDVTWKMDTTVGTRRGGDLRLAIPTGLRLLKLDVAGQNAVHPMPGMAWMAVGPIGDSARITATLVADRSGRYNIVAPVWVERTAVRAKRIGSSLSLNVVDKLQRPLPDLGSADLYRLGTNVCGTSAYPICREVLELLMGREANHEKRSLLLEPLLNNAIATQDAQRIVKYFELAKEKNPEQLIPFAQLEAVQRAYHSQKMNESLRLLEQGIAQAVYQAELADLGMLKKQDAYVAAWNRLQVLQQKFGNDSLTRLTDYRFGQLLYQYVDQGATTDSLGRDAWLERGLQLMRHSLSAAQQVEYGPEAYYTLAMAYLDLQKPDSASLWCKKGIEQYPRSEKMPLLQYLRAYALFKSGQYDEARKLCEKMIQGAASDSEIYRMATYILAQIHHASGNLNKALPLYAQVQEDYEDARDVVRNLERRQMRVPERLLAKEGDKVRLPIEYRNVAQVDVRVYAVDPMQILQTKKALTGLIGLNLAGISPQQSESFKLKAPSGILARQELNLGKFKPGAYLVLLRSDREQRQALLLVGDMDVELDRVRSDKVRVTAKDGRGRPLAQVHVLAKGAEDDYFVSGYTDLRGVFAADSIHGAVTLLTSHQGRYGLAEEPVDEANADIEGYNDEAPDSFKAKPLPARAPDSGTYFERKVQGMNVWQAM